MNVMCAPFFCSSSDAVAECISTSALVTLRERHASCPVLWPPAGEVSGAPEVVARPCEGAEARQDVEWLHSIWLQRLWMDVEGTYETCHYPPRTPTSPCHRDPLHRINRSVTVLRGSTSGTALGEGETRDKSARTYLASHNRPWVCA